VRSVRCCRALSIVAVVAGCLALVPAATRAAAASGFCSQQASYTGTTITWTGDGGNSDWQTASNWNPQTVPDEASTPATYQSQYVCIGLDGNGDPATVSIKGLPRHIAGIDIGLGAHLTIEPGAALYVGSVAGTAVVPSYVRAKSQLRLLASTLGGNGPVTVAGTLRWSAEIDSKGHKSVATQTSSECVFNPSQAECPGGDTPGGGRTIIEVHGQLLVDGADFGGVSLGDQRVIDNFGTLSLTRLGYIAMDNGTELVDEPHSSLDIDSPGGIYQGAADGSLPLATVSQKGDVVKDSDGTSVIGVPVSFGGGGHVKVVRGGLAFRSSKPPTASVGRAGVYASGSCPAVALHLCHGVLATSEVPQAAAVTTSSESTAPKFSTVGVALKAGPKKVAGHTVIGKAVKVKGPREFHATRLVFTYDKTMSGVSAKTKARVYRGSKLITLCKVEPVSQANPSCELSSNVAPGGSSPSSGDLTVIIETEAPSSRWLVV
jgi:hypothetical protein